jgi:uncharacterized protein with HEPN domain
MKLIELKELLSNYPLNAFVGTPKTLSIDQAQLSSDTEETIDKKAKAYLYNIADLIANNNEFLSDSIVDVRNYLSRIIGTAASLRDIIQLCEDMAKIFDNEINWARALTLQSMITILDNIIQQLNIVRNQAKGSRFVNRIRDGVSYILSQKIPELLYILSTMISIELGQCQPSDIVVAIGKGIVIRETC